MALLPLPPRFSLKISTLTCILGVQIISMQFEAKKSRESCIWVILHQRKSLFSNNLIKYVQLVIDK